MKKITSIKKLSKKKQREINRSRRKDWGELKPTTRVVENKKHYNRKKSRCQDQDLPTACFFEMCTLPEYIFQ